MKTLISTIAAVVIASSASAGTAWQDYISSQDHTTTEYMLSVMLDTSYNYQEMQIEEIEELENNVDALEAENLTLGLDLQYAQNLGEYYFQKVIELEDEKHQQDLKVIKYFKAAKELDAVNGRIAAATEAMDMGLDFKMGDFQSFVDNTKVKHKAVQNGFNKLQFRVNGQWYTGSDSIVDFNKQGSDLMLDVKRAVKASAKVGREQGFRAGYKAGYVDGYAAAIAAIVASPIGETN